MKQKVTNILCLLVSGFLPLSFSSSEEIQILESNDAFIIFEYVPTPPVLRATHGGVTVDAHGTDYTDEVGKPLLPVRTLYAGIPDPSDHLVDVLTLETETESSVDLLPVPQSVILEGVTESHFIKDEQCYSRDEYYPDRQVSTTPSYLRDQRVLALQIPLARYNPQRRALMLLRRIRLRVSFRPSGVKRSWKESPFEGAYEKLLLNYESSKFWRRPRSRKKQTEDPFLQSNFWYKVFTTEEGLYRIGYADFETMGIDPGSIDPRTLRLYNGGGKPLPESVAEPRPTLSQLPMWLKGDSDGSLDEKDYLVFYGPSTSRWEYDPPTDNYAYFDHPYTDTNVFWLTWGGEEGLRMEVHDGSLQDPNPIRPQYFSTPFRIEENRSNPSKTALNWEWGVVDLDQQEAYSFQIFGVEPDSAVFHGRFRTDVPRGVTGVTHRFRVYLNGTDPSDLLVDTSTTWETAVKVTRRTDRLHEGTNQIIVEHYRLAGDQPGSILNVDFFELRYGRSYSARDNRLSFTPPRPIAPGTYEFEIRDLQPQEPFVLDITDPLRPSIFANWELTGDVIKFQTDVDSVRSFYATSSEGLMTPSKIETSDLHHLRSSPGGDYVVLFHDDFFYAVPPLIEWRRQGFANPTAVKISSVYDEFAWGLEDPTAIRDFLKFWYDQATYRPSCCLLVGDGSFDYKNYLGLENHDDFIPPTPDCEDDWFGMMDPDDSLRDICMGRITPHSPQEAQFLVQRILDYERTPNYGFWRNRILLLADNLIEGGGDFPGDIEELANDHIPNHFDVRKIHLVYRTYDESHEWPIANEDAIEEWSNGFLAGCYMGHGGPHTVAHEQLLLYKDISSFENGPRLPLFYSASCDIGRFDVPGDPCIGEDLLKVEGGGAVAVIAASRPTFHSANRRIAFDLFREILFTRPTPTLGAALLVAKPGKSVHTLFGDPASRVTSATRSVKVSASPDSLSSRSRVTVVDSLPQGFSGYANIYAFDSAELDTLGADLILNIPGVPIFRGTIRAEGVDTLSFLVPMGLHWTGELGRLSCYAWNDTAELVGLLDSLKVGGVAPPLPDTAGPSVTLFEGDRALQDGDFVPSVFQLTGLLEDSSGIYIIPRESSWFLLMVNGYEEADLSRRFMYDVGSTMKGRFTYTLRLNEGENQVRVVARDNLLNRSAEEVTLQVTSPTDLAIKYAFNYPNPFSDWTYFTFYLTQPAECEIKVFTLSGRLIRSIRNIQAETGQNQIFWDGTDSDGDSIANGVYIYKIIARSHTDSSEWGDVRAETSVIEKLTVMR